MSIGLRGWFGVKGWLAGAVVLAAAAVTLFAAYLFGVRSWPITLGLGAAALLAAGALHLLWLRRAAPAPPRARGRLKVLQGGKAAPYDLAQDDSTDSQRYLM
jgi:hypothetical protein